MLVLVMETPLQRMRWNSSDQRLNQKKPRPPSSRVSTNCRPLARMKIQQSGTLYLGGVADLRTIPIWTERMPRTLEQTTQEVLELASRHFQVAAGSLAPSDDFFRKLGINSLQALELLSRLENHFSIELPDYEMQGVSDFQTLAERIQSRL